MNLAMPCALPAHDDRGRTFSVYDFEFTEKIPTLGDYYTPSSSGTIVA
jgi:hypothetical protein